jgi:hypothetical protein
VLTASAIPPQAAAIRCRDNAGSITARENFKEKNFEGLMGSGKMRAGGWETAREGGGRSFRATTVEGIMRER